MQAIQPRQAGRAGERAPAPWPFHGTSSTPAPDQLGPELLELQYACVSLRLGNPRCRPAPCHIPSQAPQHRGIPSLRGQLVPLLTEPVLEGCPSSLGTLPTPAHLGPLHPQLFLAVPLSRDSHQAQLAGDVSCTETALFSRVVLASCGLWGCIVPAPPRFFTIYPTRLTNASVC